MAIVATVTLLLVNLVAEVHIACTRRQFITNGLGIAWVAFLTIGFDPKGSAVVVTDPTGLPLLHLSHCNVFVASARDKECRMAILAAIGCNVNRMAEYRTSWFKIDLFHRMTTSTIILETKSRLTLMASATGQPFFHV